MNGKGNNGENAKGAGTYMMNGKTGGEGSGFSALLPEADSGTENDAARIFLIQRILSSLAELEPTVPKVLPDGVYGAETAEAVAAFQRLLGLEATGTVDNETFDLLLLTGRRIDEFYSPSEPIRPFDRRLAGGKLSPGDRSDLVLIVQLMLDALAFVYDFPEIAPDGRYGLSVEEAVRRFQEANGLRPTGEIDKITWNRLARAYDKYQDAE